MALSKALKDEMKVVTKDCWWKRPITWSGIRNDLELVAKGFEAEGDYQRAYRYADLAKLANLQITIEALKASSL